MAKKKKQQKDTFFNSIAKLWGWTPSKVKGKTNIDFVNVDIDAEERVSQALLSQSVALPTKLSDKLTDLFDFWLRDTTDTLAEIQERLKRINQIDFAKLNDPFIGRVLKLSASEATQIDMQDKIFSIESPDSRMTYRMYELMRIWGVNQNRSYNAIEELAAYGDHFWATTVSDQGVLRVKPIKQLQVTDKLEFSPIEAHEKLKRKEGLTMLLSKENMIKDMIDEYKDIDESKIDLADMFDTKLFGYVIDKDIIVPPWSIIHFKLNSDSEFAPFGKSSILGALSPFKLTFSTMTLQSVARLLSFPITIYSVKTYEGTDPAKQFEQVNEVREAYDNIGVTASGNNESYTVNTKIWMPKDLMEVSVESPNVEIKFTEDIEMYQDRVAIATGIPKGYLIQEWGGFGNSGVSLVEQWKPFAREVYNYQTSYLSGLADLFRLHFVISGEFDYRTPFTLSMKFPGEEMNGDKLQGRQDSLDLTQSVIDLVKTAVGVGEEEGLSPSIVRDITSKYSFLDPVDIAKWTKDATQLSVEGEGTFAGEEGGLGDEFGGDLEDDMETATEEGEFPEEGEEMDLPDIGETLTRKHNRLREKRIKETRIREINKRYTEVKDRVYLQVLVENNIENFTRAGSHIHVSADSPDLAFADILERLSRDDTSKERLSEVVSLKQLLRETKEENTNPAGGSSTNFNKDDEEDE